MQPKFFTLNNYILEYIIIELSECFEWAQY